ncbi:MFS transporter [Acetobacter musti]|uniref:MFS transporter n=1 Tax=Acetobacter musti TaxID=864732 RepID=A0ABX0JTZ0_9PROT|nr:MFS transporter [Acetobacter musti]
MFPAASQKVPVLEISPCQAGLSPALSKKLCWRFAPLLVAIYMVNQMDRSNMGYASLVMNKEIHLSIAQYGTGTSFFFVGYILCEIPSNIILSKLGARIWLSRIMISWGIISSISCLVNNDKSFYITRFILGVAEAGFFPGVMYFLTVWFPSRDRVWFATIFTMAIPASGMVSAPLSTFLMQHVSIMGLSGWRSMLFLEGIPAILLGATVFFVLPDKPERARWLTPAEKAEIRRALCLESSQEDEIQSVSGKSALTDTRVWLIGSVYFGLNSTLITILYFIPQVVNDFCNVSDNLTPLQIGLFSALPFIASIVGMWMWGRYVRQRHFHIAFIVRPMLVSALSLAAAPWLPSAGGIMTLLSMSTTGCLCAIGTFWQLPAMMVKHDQAAALALITSIGVSSGIVVGSFVGGMRETTGSYNIPFCVIAACMGASAFVVLFLARQVRTPVTAATPDR